MVKALDIFRRKNAVEPSAIMAPAAPPSVTLTAGEVRNLIAKISVMSPARLYESQANVRAAVDFRAENIASLGLHVFDRNSDNDRVRDTTSEVAGVISRPNPKPTGFELLRSFASDHDLNDDAFLICLPLSTGWDLRPVPVDCMRLKSGSEWFGDDVWEYRSGNATQDIPGKYVIRLQGWNPDYDGSGRTKLLALRDTLAEQVAAGAFRLNNWKNGGFSGNYVYRPKDAGEWASGDRNRFIEYLKQYKNQGARAGAMPMMEHGMEIRSVRFNAKEEQWLEAAQLSLELVCRVFNLQPAMLGSTGGINYGALKDMRRMLYGESLGPAIKKIEDRLNASLIPLIDGPNSRKYVEFNLQSKLAASFEEQAAVISSSVGGPWLTRNEARAMQNRPAIDGGDELIIPLNVIEGGQASPRDGAPKKATAGVLVKVKADDEEEDEPRTATGEPAQEHLEATAEVLAGFFKRQRAAVLSKLNAKADAAWWNADRWNKELAADLYTLAMQVTAQLGTDILAQLGEEPSAYDPAKTEAFLLAVSESRARWINATTLEAIQEALGDPGEGEDGEPLRSPAKVFDEAEGERGATTATTLVTTLAAFAVTETAHQLGRRSGTTATKTWRTGSTNPRGSHARMDGETVPVGERFSNGANWPADPVLSVDDIANCKCFVDITVP